MKFSAVTVLAAISASAGVSAFGFSSVNRAAFSTRSATATISSNGQLSMASEYGDLESRLFAPREPVPEPPAPPAPAPPRFQKIEKVVEETPEPVKKEKKVKEPKPPKEPKEPKKPKEKKEKKPKEPKPEPPAKVVVETPKAATPKAVETPKEKPSFNLPAISIPKPAASKPPAEGDINPLVGVALGAAPLVAVPVIGLSSLRSTLQRTQARRQKIEDEIKAAEEAKKKQVITGVGSDGEAAGKAVVSIFL